jgi:hypothetical protein
MLPAFFILILLLFPLQILSWRVVSILLPEDENGKERGCSNEQIGEPIA